MAKTIEIKPEEQFARSYVDRLILEKLTIMESAVKLGELADKLSNEGIGLATVRSLLASNPERFAYHERRWIPAARLSGSGRPFAQAMEVVIDAYNGPMPVELVVQEMCRIRRADESTVRPLVERLATNDSSFVIANDLISLTKWGFVATDENFDRALATNGVNAAEVEEVFNKLGSDFDFRAPDAVEKAVKATAPVNLKVLGAAFWKGMNSDDPRSILIFNTRDFYTQAIRVDGYIYAPDGKIYPAADAKKWVNIAVKLADRLAPQVDVDDAAPIEIKPDDAKLMAAKIAAAAGSVTATKLLEENYEITPSNKTFPDDMANLMAALKSSNNIVWVGGDRFQKLGMEPDFINEVPEPFQFVETTQVDENGDLIDVELTDDGLSSSLRKLLSHPLATDVLDEDILPAPKNMPEQLRLVLKSIHRELGTFPLAQIPTGWLDQEPKIQEAIFVDPSGRELQVWINTEARLMYNLFDWWFEQPVESGAVFTLTKTSKPNVFDFEWMDQPDPIVYISSQRIEELRELGTRAEGMTTLEILQEVMGHWPKGADYLTILAEVNVVRRSSRRLVASLLSSYQCFYQRSGSPVWHFDAKKVELGFDKTKRKFVKK